jgi:hypothetical protein
MGVFVGILNKKIDYMHCYYLIFADTLFWVSFKGEVLVEMLVVLRINRVEVESEDGLDLIVVWYGVVDWRVDDGWVDWRVDDGWVDWRVDDDRVDWPVDDGWVDLTVDDGWVDWTVEDDRAGVDT